LVVACRDRPAVDPRSDRRAGIRRPGRLAELGRAGRAGGDRLPWPVAWPGREAIAQCCDGAPGQSWLRHAVTLGSVAVSSPAALPRQIAPGKALDAGNGRPLAKSRNAAWRYLPRNLRGRACFLRDAAFLVAHLE